MINSLAIHLKMKNKSEKNLVGLLQSFLEKPIVNVTRARLSQALLDWFTAGWSGATMPGAHNIVRLSSAVFPGNGDLATFLGGTSSPLASGFVNSGIAHLREIDDAHRSAMLHPGVIAISPVLAIASSQGLTCRRVADAIIAGYEVSLRIGEALGAQHSGKFHATATAGAVGAAAASAVALSLTSDQIWHAMGIGATQSAGLWQLVDDDAHESKSLHPAFAVRNGMMAAYAAQQGFPGARAFVTGARGMYALLQGNGPLGVLDEPCSPGCERINTATIKAWPSCAQLFTALDSAQSILDQHQFSVDEIASIEVRIFPHALKIAGVNWPTKPAETCFSLRYVLAILLTKRKLSIEDMEFPDLHAESLLALSGKINVIPDDDYQKLFPNKRPASVLIKLLNGSVYEAYRELRRGDPEDPFTWEQLYQRMRDFAPAMNNQAAERIALWSKQFENSANDLKVCTVPKNLFQN